MIDSPGFLWTILFFVLAIFPLVVLHELGHLLVGRLFGVRADVFSIGFGKSLAAWRDRYGTRWQVGWLPLGGYVKFAGDMSAASEPSDEWLRLPAEERNRTFQSKPVWQRALIVLAGPAANFAFAILVFVAVFGLYGESRTPPIVASVVAGSAAEAGGLRAGDRIVQIAGSEVTRFEDIARTVAMRPNETLPVMIERGGTALTLSLTPRADLLRDRFGNEFKRGLLGIAAAKRITVPLSPIEAVGASLRFTVASVQMMAETLWQIVSGRRSVAELGGPVKIAQVSGQQATLGPLEFVLFMTMISINLGFINLLPIPTLDGGHLAFYAAEAVRRKPVGLAAQEWAFRGGLAILLGFMVFVTINDLAGLGLFAGLAGLIG